ncbi:MAG: hypothetical protein LBD29_05205 [Treponema sp.]|jgi:hypothetical protein|nr:hypothetical protein [Treponema sp.]
MANKKILGMSAAVLAFGLVFLGCNDVQEVEGGVSITKSQVATPAITEAKTTDNKYLIISWDAVDNASGYQVSMNQKDKKAIGRLSGITPTNARIYKIDGSSSVNSDSDKWNVKIPLSGAFGATLQEYRYGITAFAGGYDGLDWYNSGIAWGEYYLQTPHPYTALLGTWVKENATAEDNQKFTFEQTDSTDYPISYSVKKQNGTSLGSGDIHISYVNSGSISFTIYPEGGGYGSVDISMSFDGKLSVSSHSYSYLDGTFVKH